MGKGERGNKEWGNDNGAKRKEQMGKGDRTKWAKGENAKNDGQRR